MAWAFFFFSVIRVQVDSFEVLIPEEDKFDFVMEVTLQETTWRDTTAFFYRYTLINLPSSQQPVGALFLYYVPLEVFNPDEFELKSVNTPVESLWVEKDGIVRVGNPKTTSIGLENNFLLPGDTAHMYILSYRFLPALTYWWAYGEDSIAVVEIRGGESEDRAIWIADSVTEALGVFKQTPFGPGKYGRTVGPGPLPPSTPDSMFLHLLDRVKACHDLGWMSDRAFRRLNSMIRHAYTQSYNFTAFDPVRGARNMNRIVRTIERLHNQGEIQDEAFYVLYYRARYIHQKFQEMIPQGKE